MQNIYVSVLQNDLKKLYGSKWLLALSKYTGHSEYFLAEYFSANAGYSLRHEHKDFNNLVTDEDTIQYAKTVLLSPLHITTMVDWDSGYIKHINVLFFEENLVLVFDAYGLGGKRIPYLDDIKEVSPDWARYLILCEENDLDPVQVLQDQITLLNRTYVYSPPDDTVDEFKANQVHNYRDRSSRYIKLYHSGIRTTFEASPPL